MPLLSFRDKYTLENTEGAIKKGQQNAKHKKEINVV